ncbi:hypothetical protein [Actinopolyspora mortivallis]|uniref:hypothetical protein n=1 Tax=Actinopolyspora mortivallis TaxID=33906 RepID=UPI00039EDCA9|nr:hypothetical protein [Actinopolyspora mortivallis]
MTAPPLPRTTPSRRPSPRSGNYLLAFSGELGRPLGSDSGTGLAATAATWRSPDLALLTRVLEGLRRSRDSHCRAENRSGPRPRGRGSR